GGASARVQLREGEWAKWKLGCAVGKGGGSRETGALPWLGGGACHRLGLQAVHGRRGRDGGEANGAGSSVAWSRGDGSGGAFSNWARGMWWAYVVMVRGEQSCSPVSAGQLAARHLRSTSVA